MKGKYILKLVVVLIVVVLIVVILYWRLHQINGHSDTLQAEIQQSTFPIQDKQLTKSEIPVKNIQPKTKPIKANVVDSSISDTDVTLNPEELDLSHSFSQLPQSEEQKAFSLMIDEFGKWGFLHTVMADIEIQKGYLDPNNEKVIQAFDVLKAKTKIEVIPLEKKTNSKCVKIRVRLECEELGVVILKDDIYDNDTPPVVWSMAGKALPDDDISRIRRIFPNSGTPWNDMFMMLDKYHDDFKSFQRDQITDVRELSGELNWVPIRTSTQEEEEKHFKNQKQYLFFLDPQDLASNHWFDAYSGKLTMFENVFDYESTGAKKRRVRFEEFVDTEDGGTYFPSNFFIELHKGENEKDFGTKVQLTNVKLNEKISPTDFSIPSEAIPVK